tara:strand:- start:1246 stop:2652 length:1407 start_codon:yes stop_codon:yes gene_type:complete
MNLIISGFYNKKQVGVIQSIIADYTVDQLYVFSEEKYNQKLFEQAHKVFVISDIIKGDYGVEQSILDPLDREVIQSMHLYEADIMRMMDRFEVYLKAPILYDERKVIYFKHLRYWSHVLNNTKIDLFISSNIPHDIYDFVIMSLCKIKNIPTLFFYQGQVTDAINPMVNYKKGTTDLPLRYNYLLSKYLNANKIDISENIESLWKQMRKEEVPFYMKQPSFNLFNIITKLIKQSLSVLKGNGKLVGFKRKWQNFKLQKAYEKVTKIPDLNSKYIYVPLHYQPELTSCPLGVGYENQYLIIQMLDYYLPEGYFIYVKENPKQEIYARYNDYYADILKSTKKVVFVPLETSTFELMKNAQAIATITGTAGWEALFKKKPVMVFGHNFYQYAPGVSLIKTKEDAQKAINDIIDETFVYDENKLKLFMQAVEDTAIKGHIDLLYKQVSKITTEESVINISYYINKFIAKNLC